MLFHATHVHTHETCPATPGDFGLARQTFGKVLSDEHAQKVGVKLVASYVDSPAHTAYFIIEADSAEKITLFLMPLLKLGSAEIRPVSRADDTFMRKMEKALTG